MGGITRVLIVLAMLVLIGGAGAAFLVFRFLSTSPSDADDQIVFEVKPGESFKTIARHLQEQGLVTNSLQLELYVRLTRIGAKVRVGEYALRKNFHPREIMSVLVSGKSIEYPITIPEGSNRFEIAEIVGKTKFITREKFLELTTDRAFIEEVFGKPYDSFEGYLYPETYHLTKYTGARAVVRMMVARFRENYAKVQVVPGWNRGTLTDHQLVTLASIVEKETGAPEERPVISSVFHNRLNVRMPLQTDPTIIYGIYLDKGNWNKAISRADLQRPHPYNSYLNHGLPPGPISNPGFEALSAAGKPAKTEFLFFVSRNDGTHAFSKQYSQHQKAVSDFQLNARARQGKSWRDLKKRDLIPERVIEAPVHKAPPKKNATPKPKPSSRSN